MHRILSTLVTIALFVGAAFSSSSAGPKPKTTPVTSTIQDLRPDNTPYRIHSDSPLSGTNTYTHNVNSVVSQFQSPPEWELSTLSSTTRKIFVDFGDPAPGSSTSSAPFTSQYVVGRFVTQCFRLYNPGGGPNDYIAVGNMIGLNFAQPCPMLLRFDLNGIIYRVEMDQIRYPGSDDALVTCTGVVDPLSPSTSQCNKWTIGPTAINGGTDAGGQPRNLTELVKVTTSKGKTTEQHLGYYFMTFNIGISNP